MRQKTIIINSVEILRLEFILEHSAEMVPRKHSFRVWISIRLKIVIKLNII